MAAATVSTQHRMMALHCYPSCKIPIKIVYQSGKVSYFIQEDILIWKDKRKPLDIVEPGMQAILFGRGLGLS